ncbi:MAG: hypothetical protein ACT4PL_11985 [Phycisphaerales bacterium]
MNATLTIQTPPPIDSGRRSNPNLLKRGLALVLHRRPESLSGAAFRRFMVRFGAAYFVFCLIKGLVYLAVGGSIIALASR